LHNTYVAAVHQQTNPGQDCLTNKAASVEAVQAFLQIVTEFKQQNWLQRWLRNRLWKLQDHLLQLLICLQDLPWGMKQEAIASSQAM